MLENFQLAAIVRQKTRTQILRVPMHQALQRSLAEAWHGQRKAFLGDVEEIAFDPAYRPDEGECFVLEKFELPPALAGESSTTAADLDPITDHEDLLPGVRGLIGFAREDRTELVLFQNFTRAHVIQPGRFLLLKSGTYESMQHPGLTLDDKLSAIYRPAEQKLLFYNFRTVNSFLPLTEFYAEASEEQIREVLAHDKLAPVNVDAVAGEPSQWLRKRFALLRDSGVLDKFSAKEIKAHSKGYDVEITVKSGKIVFPEEKHAVKKLLQFLNEELFRGAITNTLYETNSKRAAD